MARGIVNRRRSKKVNSYFRYPKSALHGERSVAAKVASYPPLLNNTTTSESHSVRLSPQAHNAPIREAREREYQRQNEERAAQRIAEEEAAKTEYE